MNDDINRSKFINAFNYKLIYIFRINDGHHKGLLKIGDTTVKINGSSLPLPNSEVLNIAAKNRINKYTSTAGIVYELLYTEIAVNDKNEAFRDHDVHVVLKNSGRERKFFNTEKRQDEWFMVDLETAKNAIKAVKQGHKALTAAQITNDRNPVEFRPSQLEAIEKTISRFQIGNKMLWNAKMRFGKTISALEIVKRKRFTKTIIITHRPVVSDSWFEDFNKIFYDTNDYLFGSKHGMGESLSSLLVQDKNFVYFISMQDLRGSNRVGGNFDKNHEIFNIDWDFVVIDEAHEGTSTVLGKAVLEEIIKKDSNHDTKVLHLSGTPFNLLSSFEENETYTWDYVMEQEAKENWSKNHYLDWNPYAELPKLNIFTYDLGDLIKGYREVEDKAFNFREFFRTWTGNIETDRKVMPNSAKIGDFVHEEDVKKFLALLVIEDEDSNYPYSTIEYRDFFRHSLWMVPGVKEAKALSKLLHESDVFGNNAFRIVNVAGDGDEEEEYQNALRKVKNAIGDKPEETYTITLSCGRLTTGVSVSPWTAVFMLSGTYSTSASSYLQTIFRVQTPANIGGRIKENCYVFDFAPDRTLKMIAEAGNLNIEAGSINDKVRMNKFLNFCPVVAIKGSRMVPYDAEHMLRVIKKAYADRVVRNGFDDIKIYNNKLFTLDKAELSKFKDLEAIIGKTKQTEKTTSVDVNNQGLTKEQKEELERIQNKRKKELTEEEKQRLKELKELRKQRNAAMSILRGISIRIPLLIYGADIDDTETEITPENFTDLIDDLSWKEFMPKGVTKDKYKDFSKYYDKEIFVEAGVKIRREALGADELSPIERVKRIASIFSTFRNPDKETVLTPWRVVNMHLGDCFGGYNFYDESYNYTLEVPRYIANTKTSVFSSGSKILEINSKSGLYALYCMYSIYRQRCLNIDFKKLDERKEKELWQRTLKENIFVICKTKMAELITRRTLMGYNNFDINIVCYENIVNILENKPEEFINKTIDSKTWNRMEEFKMKFDAIVGNPPYQEIISSGGNNSSLGKQIFPNFIINTIKLHPNFISLITPSRWFTGEAQDGSFPKLREFVKRNNHFVRIINYPNGKDVFDNVIIAGGVNYYLYAKEYVGDVDFVESYGEIKKSKKRPLFEEGIDIIVAIDDIRNILSKVKDDNFLPLTNITKGRNAFGIVGKKDIVEKISKLYKFDGAVKLQCAYEEIRWIEEKNITKNVDVFNSWKVFTSKGNGGAGTLLDDKPVAILGKPYIAEPKVACTDSLIPIGCFETKEEALNLQKYLKTKFLRFMVGILKVSQNIYQNVYQLVPIQNFTNKSDVDWSKSIDEIDMQLFKKYNLTEEEIKYLESKIKSTDN